MNSKQWEFGPHPLSCASLLEEKKLWTFLVESIVRWHRVHWRPCRMFFPAWAFFIMVWSYNKKQNPWRFNCQGSIFYYSMKIKSSLASTIWEIVEGWKYSEHCLHLQVDVRTLFLLYFKVTGWKPPQELFSHQIKSTTFDFDFRRVLFPKVIKNRDW